MILFFYFIVLGGEWSIILYIVYIMGRIKKYNGEIT